MQDVCSDIDKVELYNVNRIGSLYQSSVLSIYSIVGARGRYTHGAPIEDSMTGCQIDLPNAEYPPRVHAAMVNQRLGRYIKHHRCAYDTDLSLEPQLFGAGAKQTESGGLELTWSLSHRMSVYCLTHGLCRQTLHSKVSATSRENRVFQRQT
jgi:hypothetical protein